MDFLSGILTSTCPHADTFRLAGLSVTLGLFLFSRCVAPRPDTRRPPAAAVLSPPLSTRPVLEPGASSLGTEGGRVREAELQEGPSSLKASCWEGHCDKRAPLSVNAPEILERRPGQTPFYS